MISKLMSSPSMATVNFTFCISSEDNSYTLKYLRNSIKADVDISPFLFANKKAESFKQEISNLKIWSLLSTAIMPQS